DRTLRSPVITLRISSLQDSGPGTLRAAIAEADTFAGTCSDILNVTTPGTMPRSPALPPPGPVRPSRRGAGGAPAELAERARPRATGGAPGMLRRDRPRRRAG